MNRERFSCVPVINWLSLSSRPTPHRLLWKMDMLLSGYFSFNNCCNVNLCRQKVLGRPIEERTFLLSSGMLHGSSVGGFLSARLRQHMVASSTQQTAASPETLFGWFVTECLQEDISLWTAFLSSIEGIFLATPYHATSQQLLCCLVITAMSSPVRSGF